MSATVAIITPAFNAQATLPATVRSVRAQTHGDWRHWIVADDGFDYASFLAGHDLLDSRQVFVGSGGVARGASRARNVALAALNAPYAAILDADDRFKPEKLARALAGLADQAIVTTALDVMDTAFSHLRHVGAGPDRVLRPGAHKWVNLSMDSMLVWDRARADARYDPGLSNMTDLEFLLQLYGAGSASLHLGAPLHDYIKRDGSMSNAETASAGMLASKREILLRLETGHYRLPPADVAGLARFLRVSLAAEAGYGAARAARPGLLFEDHLQPLLHAPDQFPNSLRALDAS